MEDSTSNQQDLDPLTGSRASLNKSHSLSFPHCVLTLQVRLNLDAIMSGSVTIFIYLTPWLPLPLLQTRFYSACVIPLSNEKAVTQDGVSPFHRYAPELPRSVEEGKYLVCANMNTQFVSGAISGRL